MVGGCGAGKAGECGISVGGRDAGRVALEGDVEDEEANLSGGGRDKWAYALGSSLGNFSLFGSGMCRTGERRRSGALSGGFKGNSVLEMKGLCCEKPGCDEGGNEANGILAGSGSDEEDMPQSSSADEGASSPLAELPEFELDELGPPESELSKTGRADWFDLSKWN